MFMRQYPHKLRLIYKITRFVYGELEFYDWRSRDHVYPPLTVSLPTDANSSYSSTS